MQTPFTDSVVVFGILGADGTVRLDFAPPMPPGRIQLTIRPASRPHERLPDLPVEDSSPAPPLDLPRFGVIQEVRPIQVLHRLPDFQSTEAA